jgi:hypothetical protein
MKDLMDLSSMALHTLFLKHWLRIKSMTEKVGVLSQSVMLCTRNALVEVLVNFQSSVATISQDNSLLIHF